VYKNILNQFNIYS